MTCTGAHLNNPNSGLANIKAATTNPERIKAGAEFLNTNYKNFVKKILLEPHLYKMEVLTNLEQAELKEVEFLHGVVQIQLTFLPSQEYCETLNELLEKKKNIKVRFYNYEGAFKDLTFLKYLSNISHLIIYDRYRKC